ncbi:hypothetical protein ABT354_20060 [Streptomyces sp. NPDC000594]|uniref:hypothetical protein n=1 Tax=Streptomyces sp. NPDC000594 TaxID=3154261 RepID=UPI003320DEE2
MKPQQSATVTDHVIPAEAQSQAVNDVAALVHRAARRDEVTEEAVLSDLSDAMLGAVYQGYALAIAQDFTGQAREDAARRTAYQKLCEGGAPGLAYRTVLRLWGRPRRRRPTLAPGV